ncbi:MAG: hypothetical protein HYZ14_03305 [Bacteroidetes bacterium]|nr:hypothetical protein [Bacteroidota bacterium]
MKHLICFLLLFTTGLFAFSQTADLSLAELKTEYLKKRNSSLSSSGKKIPAEQQAELDALVKQLEAKDAESYEYNLVAYINSNYNTDLKESLFKAYALKSSEEEVVKEMLGFYVITSNTAKQKEFLIKVQKFYTPAELAYYADAMPSGKTILFTSNQEDMYGFMVAQTSNGIGTDVQIMNLDFMKNETYREMVSNAAGITDMTFLGNEKAYLKTVLTSSSQKIQVSATVPQDYLSLVSDKIYLTGLSYQYGNVDQFTALNNFWSKVKTKDMSQFTLTKSSENKLYGNYLPPLLTLYMMQPGDQVLKTTIQAIAAKVGKSQEVDEILKEIQTD